MKALSIVAPIAGGLVAGYLFFLFAGFIPGVAVFFVPEAWRDTAVGGFARGIGATMFVFVSSALSRSDRPRVLTVAIWIAVGYFAVMQAFFIWAYVVEVAGSLWFPSLMGACGVAGVFVGRAMAVNVDKGRTEA